MTDEDFQRLVKNANIERGEDQQITLAANQPIKDPDDRKGYEDIDRDQAVYFHVLLADLPSLRLEQRKLGALLP